MLLETLYNKGRGGGEKKKEQVFYLQRKSPTDVYAFVKLTDLPCLSVLFAELPLCFCSENWLTQTQRGFFGGIVMGYKKKQAGRVVGDEWMYRG